MSQLKKYIATTVSGQIVSLVLGVLSTILLARGLGSDERGTYALVLWMPMSLAFFTPLGQVQVNSLFAGLHKEKRGELFSISLLITLVMSVVGLLIYFAYFFWLPIPRGKFALLPPQLIYLSALLIPFLTLEPQLSELARGSLKVRDVVLVTNFGLLAQVGLTAIFVYWMQLGVNAAIWNILVVRAFTVIGYLFVLRTTVSIKFYRPNYGFLKECLRYGLIFMFSSGAMSLINQVGPFILGYSEVSKRDIGLYAVAMLLAQQMGIIPTAISQAFLPWLSNTPEAIEKDTPRIFKMGSILCFAMTIVMALATWPAINILLGREFLGSVPLVLAMLPGLTAFGAIRVLGVYLWVIRKPQYGLISNWIVLLLLISLSIVFVKIMGSIGASIACSISFFALSSFTLWAYLKESKNSLYELMIEKNDLISFWMSIRDVIIKVKRNLIIGIPR